MLAGLLMVNEGQAPGRPPGVAPRSLLAGGPQRANRQRYNQFVLKELAMKTFIIATVLCVGVLLRPQVAPSGVNQQENPKTEKAGVVVENENVAQPLPVEQLAGVCGAGIFDCTWLIEDGIVYGRCCVGFWIFKVCGYIEVGPLPKPPTN